MRRTEILNDIGSKLPADSNFDIHLDKMTKKIFEALPELGLAKVSDSHEDFLEFEPATGALYMTCLANKMAERRQLPIVSDDPIYHPFIRFFQSGHINNSEEETSYALASLVINSAIPEDINSISIEKIIKFREKNEENRIIFYDNINDIAKEIPKIEDPQSYADCLEYHKKKIDKSVKSFKSNLKEMGIGTAPGLIGLSLPAWATRLSQNFPESGILITSIGLTTIGAGIITHGGIKYYNYRKNNPWSYVLSLQKLRQETFLERMFPKVIF